MASPNQIEGSEEPTDATVAKVEYMSMARGTLIRYLEPGDRINMPADRVEVTAIGEAGGEE